MKSNLQLTHQTIPTLMIALSDTLKAEFIASLDSKIPFQVIKIVDIKDDIFELLQIQNPDYLLVDNEASNGANFGFLRKLSRLNPYTKVIVYSNSYSPEYLKTFVSSPAVGFIQYGCGINDFILCMKSIFQDKRIIFSNMSEHKQPRDDNRHNVNKDMSLNLSILTNREMEIWELLTKGKTEKQIAEFLTISVSTVRTHKNNISEKLAIKGKQRLLSLAISCK